MHAEPSPPSLGSNDVPPALVLYDGVCGLCDRVVQWLLDHDTAGRLRFAALQGETAERLRRQRPEIPTGIDSVVFVLREDATTHVFLRAEAVFRLTEFLGLRPWWLRLSRRLPRPLADLGYRLVAASRYRLFGKFDECRIPSPEVRARFLP